MNQGIAAPSSGGSPFAGLIHKVSAVPAAGIAVEHDASATERLFLVEALGILAVDRLTVSYRLRPSGDGRFAMTGRVAARVTQACVVTLEPVGEAIDEPIDCTFVPAADANRPQSEEEEALALDDLEPIVGDAIDVGRVVYEVVAAALDPFPRTDGASLAEGGSVSAGSDEGDHPFAALAGLARRPPED
jgi:uncharacterized metal-binding protein YceD (DUF177 family)